jgi:hypothetical protein
MAHILRAEATALNLPRQVGYFIVVPELEEPTVDAPGEEANAAIVMLRSIHLAPAGDPQSDQRPRTHELDRNFLSTQHREASWFAQTSHESLLPILAQQLAVRASEYEMIREIAIKKFERVHVPSQLHFR